MPFPAPLLTALLVALLGAGCASSDFAGTSDGAAGNAYRGEVAVLERFPREGTFDRLGVVLVRGVGLTSDARMFEELKSEAAGRGANAVVLQNRQILERVLGDGSTERRLAAFAIRRRE